MAAAVRGSDGRFDLAGRDDEAGVVDIYEHGVWVYGDDGLFDGRERTRRPESTTSSPRPIPESAKINSSVSVPSATPNAPAVWQKAGVLGASKAAT